MTGFKAVTRIGFRSTSSAIRPRLTVKPATALSARTRAALPRMVMDSSRLSAISGNITFSSKLPRSLPMVTARSLAITWAQTIIVASQITGLILPGIMLEPGCSAGSVISPSPAMGPLFIQRKSLAIFISAEAAVLR